MYITACKAIKVQSTGKAKCKWMEILRKNSNDSNRSLFYTSKEIFAYNEMCLPAFDPQGLELNSGEHVFDFSFTLATHLPSAFKGNYGAIKHKMCIIIQRPWAFDERHVIPLMVMKNMPLPLGYRLHATPLEKQITKTISLFGTRPITMLALLPEEFAVRGEPMRICVTVINNSNTNVEKLRFCILQYINYHSFLPVRRQKTEIITIATKETGAVQKKSERSFAHELIIPLTAQPTDHELSDAINISYELRVEAVLRGLFKNLVLNLPFTLYSNELGESRERPRPLTSGNGDYIPALGNGAGNPFEPDLEDTVGSPTHSSQRGESSESSSMNSTTTDSSAATLSPAVGGTVLSYTSDSSSMCNNTSTRASLRSSNVPYLRYWSSSPPYAAVSDSPRHNLSTRRESGASRGNTHFTHCPAVSEAVAVAAAVAAAANDSTLMQAAAAAANDTAIMNAAAAAAAVSFLSSRSSQGAQELPPSYEELFGNASAPPVSTPSEAAK
uniref:Arrestin_C domain-containing protein n=1 Tax=Glossina pallidipes TaxID=7398 RepID=A0A1A9Z9X0_GLOPL